MSQSEIPISVASEESETEMSKQQNHDISCSSNTSLGSSKRSSDSRFCSSSSSTTSSRSSQWSKEFWKSKLKRLMSDYPEMGFDRKLECEQIVGATEIDRELVFQVKWLDCDELDFG